MQHQSDCEVNKMRGITVIRRHALTVERSKLLLIKKKEEEICISSCVIYFHGTRASASYSAEIIRCFSLWEDTTLLSLVTCGGPRSRSYVSSTSSSGLFTSIQRNMSYQMYKIKQNTTVDSCYSVSTWERLSFSAPPLLRSTTHYTWPVLLHVLSYLHTLPQLLTLDRHRGLWKGRWKCFASLANVLYFGAHKIYSDAGFL